MILHMPSQSTEIWLFFKMLFMLTTNKSLKFCVVAFVRENPRGGRCFSLKRASNVESVSVSCGQPVLDILPDDGLFNYVISP